MDTTRVASLFYPDLARATRDAEPLWHQVDAIRARLRRHLPAATASLLARPQADAGQPGRLQWYSDLAGQPVAFDALSDAEQARALALVDDRLRSIRQLADELEAAPEANALSGHDRDPGADQATPALLRQAACYPHPRCIYLVDNEPVLTYWGLDAPRSATRGGGPLGEPPPSRPRARRMRPVIFIALALLLGALALGGWNWFQASLRGRLQADLDAGLAAQCASTGLLEALWARLQRIDPEGQRFPGLRLDTERELNRCADAADLDARLRAAWEDCARLPEVEQALLLQDLGEPPFPKIEARLRGRLAECRLAEDLTRRLAEAAGDCDALIALAGEPQPQGADDYPLADPLGAIAAAAEACRIEAELRPRLAGAAGDCWALRELDRAFGQRIARSDGEGSGPGAGGPDGAAALATGEPGAGPRPDLSRGPLAGLRADLDAALQRCALADHLAERLGRSQGDCVELFSLHETLSRQGTRGPPFDAIAARLDESLAQCAALNDLETRFTRAQGDCDLVTGLSGELERWRDNLRFVDIRARVAAELGICAQADALMRDIANLGMDCPRLRELAEVVAKQAGTQFDRARSALKSKLLGCARLADYNRRLTEAGSHCGRLKALRRDLAGEKGSGLEPIRQRLDKALEPCQRKPDPVIAGPPRGGGAYALSGQCSGELVIAPAQGYHGDRVRHIVRIAPPGNAAIAKVVSDNRGCRDCRLTKRNATTWSVGLYYGCSGVGPIPIAYSAFDGSGKLVCSGRGVAHCLGRRR